MIVVGQKVKFRVYDNLAKKNINCTGTVRCNTVGKLWLIRPDMPNKGLSGNDIQVHENAIT